MVISKACVCFRDGWKLDFGEILQWTSSSLFFFFFCKSSRLALHKRARGQYIGRCKMVANTPLYSGGVRVGGGSRGQL